MIYVIGDIQGCYASFQKVLEQINFNPTNDTLWFTGDLVNRGPDSLSVLRYIKNLGSKHITVLGNHDLHLLAFLFDVAKYNPSDTLVEIAQAPDRIDLIEWLRHLPILHDGQGYLLSHAGIAPMWSRQKANEIAKEIELTLQGDRFEVFLREMYGNKPERWHDDLAGIDRLRCALNYFTRMRFCYADGSLNLTYKGTIEAAPKDLIPWFDIPNRANENEQIVFGHWAALGGITHKKNVYALDTGCVWGNCLTAMRLEDHKRFEIPCAERMK